MSGALRMCEKIGTSYRCDTLLLQHAQMARDWNNFTFVGYAQSNLDVVSFFDVVKQ